MDFTLEDIQNITRPYAGIVHELQQKLLLTGTAPIVANTMAWYTVLISKIEQLEQEAQMRDFIINALIAHTGLNIEEVINEAESQNINGVEEGEDDGETRDETC